MLARTWRRGVLPIPENAVRPERADQPAGASPARASHQRSRSSVFGEIRASKRGAVRLHAARSQQVRIG